jgi:hypothetical protein
MLRLVRLCISTSIGKDAEVGLVITEHQHWQGCSGWLGYESAPALARMLRLVRLYYNTALALASMLRLLGSCTDQEVLVLVMIMSYWFWY